LKSVELIEPPISLRIIRQRLPEFKWANYPRSVTTPPRRVASKLIRLLSRNVARHGGKRENTGDDLALDLEDIVKSHIGETTRRALLEARVGQGKFRVAVGKRWEGQCAVTGCSIPSVLRASHIKPWSKSSNEERLNPANGILLAAHVDALFDSGLISFSDAGKILMSSSIRPQIKRLELPAKLRRHLTNSEKSFLAYHRRYVFDR
jgi:hypothetical protein